MAWTCWATPWLPPPATARSTCGALGRANSSGPTTDRTPGAGFIKCAKRDLQIDYRSTKVIYIADEIMGTQCVKSPLRDDVNDIFYVKKQH